MMVFREDVDAEGDVVRVCVPAAESIKTISFILCMYRRRFGDGKRSPSPPAVHRKRRVYVKILPRKGASDNVVGRPVDKGEKLGTNV